MKKRELLERIEQLEQRLATVEGLLEPKHDDPVFVPSVRMCTCPQAWWGTLPPPPCPVHGPFTFTTTTIGTEYVSPSTH